MSEHNQRDENDWTLPRWWAGCNVLLVLLTWRLWFVTSEYPAVSLLGPDAIFSDAIVSRVVLWVASLTLVVGLLLITVDAQRFRAVWLVVFTAHLVGFLFDQHRLQPWAYQTAIYAVVFATLPRRLAQRLLVLVAASIYFYSALGKFDFQFLHTVGQDFLGVLFRPFGGLPEGWDAGSRARLALMFPCTELVIAIGLVFPPTRKLFAIAVMIMHMTLILILGPWGLNHSLGVLGWNALLCFQGYRLFFCRYPSTDMPESANVNTGSFHAWRLVRWLALILVIGILIAPLLERRGYWDHWLSWSLYSPHTSRVELDIHQSAVDRLDSTLAPHLQEDADGDGWRRLALDQWSLTARGVPVYPQARYQLGLAVSTVERLGADDACRAIVRGTSDRWTGRRRETPIFGLDDLRHHGRTYWLWAH